MTLEEPIRELSQTPLEYFPFNLKELGRLTLEGKKGLVNFPLMLSGNELYQILRNLRLKNRDEQISNEELKGLKEQADFSTAGSCPARLVEVGSLPLKEDDKNKYQLAVAIDTYNAKRRRGTRHILLTDKDNKVYRLFPPLHFTQEENGVIDWETIINEGNTKVEPLKIDCEGKQVFFFGSLTLNLANGIVSFLITNYKI